MSEFTNISLPDRPLKIVGGTNSKKFIVILIAGFMLILGVALLAWQLPGVLRDWKISQNPITVYDSDVRNGSCDSRKGLTTCDADVIYTHNGKRYEDSVSISFFDLQSGDYTVDVVISETEPELVTLSLGIEKLWNRIIVLGLFSALFLGVALGALIQHSRVSRNDRNLSKPGRIKIVPVSIKDMTSAGKTTNVTYLYSRENSGRQGKNYTSFGKKQAPLFLEDDEGNIFGLAAKHEAATIPVMLDENLKRLDLTEEERRTALASLGIE